MKKKAKISKSERSDNKFACGFMAIFFSIFASYILIVKRVPRDGANIPLSDEHSWLVAGVFLLCATYFVYLGWFSKEFK